jgi:hypothetical protein
MSYNVGQSKVKTYRNCRRAYFYKYHEELIRKRTKRPFLFGKIVHKMIEVQSQGEDPFEMLERVGNDVDNAPVFAAEKEMYGDIITDIGVIMTDYFEYHRDGLRLIPVPDKEGELSYSEHDFAIPLEELVSKKYRAAAVGVVFKGQVDGLAKTPNKLRWLFETKTFDKMPGDDERWRNLQSVVYIRAVKHLGWMKSVDGVCWNYVMSKTPTVPQLLKSGKTLSVRDITTLPSVVVAAIKVHKLKIADHAKLMERAEASRNNYFQRIFTPVNETIADQIFDGFVETAIEMRDNAGRKKDQNIGRHCSWCDYEPICRAQLTGGDVDYVKSIEFVKEDPEAYRSGKRSDKLRIIG